MRKYEKGEIVTNISEIAGEEFIYFHNKIYHKGWWQSWQYIFIIKAISVGVLYKAKKKGSDGE